MKIPKFKETCLYNLADKLKIYDKVYIYGAGQIGKFIFNYIDSIGAADKVEAFVVTGPRGGVRIFNLMQFMESPLGFLTKFKLMMMI